MDKSSRRLTARALPVCGLVAVLIAIFPAGARASTRCGRIGVAGSGHSEGQDRCGLCDLFGRTWADLRRLPDIHHPTRRWLRQLHRPVLVGAGVLALLSRPWWIAGVLHKRTQADRRLVPIRRRLGFLKETG
jgi:hypothetical protein